MKVLHKKLKKIEKLDKTIVDNFQNFLGFNENFSELWSNVLDFIELRKDIKESIADKPNIVLRNENIKDILNRINNNDEFKADIVFKEVMNFYYNSKKDSDELSDFEKLRLERSIDPYNFDISDLEDFSDFVTGGQGNPYSIAENLIKIGVLITNVEVPASLKIFVDEARWCYAIENHNSVYSLCRTMIEVACHDIKKRQRGIEHQKTNGKKESVAKLIKSVTRREPELRQNLLDVYYEELSKIVHGVSTIDSKSSEDMLRSTLMNLQKLYQVSRIR